VKAAVLGESAGVAAAGKHYGVDVIIGRAPTAHHDDAADDEDTGTPTEAPMAPLTSQRGHQFTPAWKSRATSAW
jgi:hypothetical protein